MSLRELGVFNPLREGHQAVGTRCAECDRVLGVGVSTALRPQDPHAKGTVECDLL